MNQFWQTGQPRLSRMAESRAIFTALRAGSGGFIFITAFYCLLFYIPFSRHALFSWNVVPALTLFARYHALAYWVMLLPACLTITPYLKDPKLRRPTIGLIVALGSMGVALLFYPLLPNLPPDERSLIWSVVSLFPLGWIVALDWKSGDNFQPRSAQALTRTNVKAIVATAACVSGIYLGIFLLRYVFTGAPAFSRSSLILLSLCSFALHALLFGLILSAFRVTDAIARTISNSPKLIHIVRGMFLILALALIMRKVVFSSVSFNGVGADFTAVIFSFSFVGFFLTSLLRFGTLCSKEEASQPASIFGRIKKLRGARVVLAALSIVAISVFAYSSLVNLEGVDWQGLLQKISVLLVWLATFVVFRSFAQTRPAKRYSVATLILLLLFSTGLYVIIQHERPSIARTLRQRAGPTALLIEQYADYDPSFNVATEMLAPAKVDVFEGSAEDHFFAVLRENTNLPPEVAVAPKEFKLVDEIKPALDDQPNIFVFVIDSLRQDYLSPYNPKVNFTPAIDGFARDSVVMKNAFTRYDGTALAEPSIWSGGMQVHKQFVQPFYPMNSLQRLVDAEHYRSFITIDPILKSILKPSNEIVELDRGVDWKQYDLVATLSELQADLQKGESRQPYFVYSQPQNLHQVSLKLNRRPAQTGPYDGFEARHVAELARIDKAFGEFVSFLKSRGAYDDSVIILTADHGDSLGEGGHWGHGNAIYPELIRIPLIIHLPEKLKSSLVSDPNTLAFTTDITPTLYYLLGQRPIRNDVMFGRPLFTLTMEEQKAYLRDSYLIGDSYGPVYALLRDGGRTLFVADAVRNQAYIYDLSHSYAGERVTIDDEVASECQQAIASEIKKIQVFYNYQPPSQIVSDSSQPGKIAQLYSLLFAK
jgi:hypothetical protein